MKREFHFRIREFKGSPFEPPHLGGSYLKYKIEYVMRKEKLQNSLLEGGGSFFSYN